MIGLPSLPALLSKQEESYEYWFSSPAVTNSDKETVAAVKFIQPPHMLSLWDGCHNPTQVNLIQLRQVNVLPRNILSHYVFPIDYVSHYALFPVEGATALCSLAAVYI